MLPASGPLTNPRAAGGTAMPSPSSASPRLTGRFDRAAMTPALSVHGLELRPGYLDRAAQEALLAAVRETIRQAPLYTPTMPRTGQPFSVRMTNCGPLGRL